MSLQEPKTRRGMILYNENPFVNTELVDTVKTRVKRITNKKGDLYVRAADDGEMTSAAGFWQSYEVESTQFIKLYVRGVKAFKELTGAGTKVFELLYFAMQKAIDKDRVFLTYTAEKETSDISKATFTRGMRELIDKGFIAPTPLVGWFWINPNYAFNGDRLILVNEYRRKATNGKPKQQVTGQMEMDVLALMGESAEVHE